VTCDGQTNICDINCNGVGACNAGQAILCDADDLCDVDCGVNATCIQNVQCLNDAVDQRNDCPGAI